MNAKTLKAIGAALLLTSISSGAIAQSDYPNRAITLIVSFAPGGLSDVPARLLAAEMQGKIGQNIIVENKPGASGTIGGAFFARSAPDGYTLLASATAETQNLHYLSVPYKATEFSHIGKIANGPSLVLITNASSPHKTVKDLISYAKANPGKVSFSTSGPATSPAIAVAQLNKLADTDIVSVAYRGTGPAATAVLTGEVQAAWVFYTSAKPLVDDGKARVLAVASAKRLPELPDTPTMDEVGYPGFDHTAFIGLSAPANTPPAIIEKLNRALNETVNTPEFRKKLEPLGMRPPPAPNSPQEYTEFMSAEIARQGELAAIVKASAR
ncbi:MAG TPA: tripartite tricarboxylate transporter substrate binding protein [Pseudolabrys sp.]|nr:tripartite tricarboxylate transporter substrate binding protein [Pseudolabrys sp.]